jgi:flavin reductase (DIM6/NTAB) family NADH-FMN oxidoreductase RutF
MATSLVMDEARGVPVERFRHALGRFATGVTVITTRDADGRKHGVTATSFGSLSLSPPLVQWSLRKAAFSHSVFCTADRFAINILASDQEHVSRTFSSPVEDRFAVTAHRLGDYDLPLIDGALAWLECALETEISGGDHSLFIGRVLSAEFFERDPLLHWGGGYHHLRPV